VDRDAVPFGDAIGRAREPGREAEPLEEGQALLNVERSQLRDGADQPRARMQAIPQAFDRCKALSASIVAPWRDAPDVSEAGRQRYDHGRNEYGQANQARRVFRIAHEDGGAGPRGDEECASREAICAKPELGVREGLLRPKAIDVVRRHEIEHERNAQRGDDSARYQEGDVGTHGFKAWLGGMGFPFVARQAKEPGLTFRIANLITTASIRDAD